MDAEVILNEREYDDERNYQRLMTALEASQGILNLLIAVCDDEAVQRAMTDRYETELREQGVFCGRLRVSHRQPSLRLALEQMVAQQSEAMAGEVALTVEGVDGLLSLRLNTEQSEQERFFGYLQWTREALLAFKFPIVVWMKESMVDRLAERAPDFWSWRGGVFWFEGRHQTEQIAKEDSYVTQQQSQSQTRSEQKRKGALSIEELLRLIASIEAQQGKDAPLLASLYGQLGEVHEQLIYFHGLHDGNRNDDYHSRKALDSYKQALKLFREVNAQLGEAIALRAIGDILLLKRQTDEALENYQKAIDIFRKVGGAQLGKANTLKAIGDVLQFKRQTNDALNSYQQAIDIFREVGDEFGEANTLKAIGDVLQSEKRADEALASYQQAVNIFRNINASLGEANTLKAIGDVLQFKKRIDEASTNYKQAIDIFHNFGASLGEANTLQGLASLEKDKSLALEALERAQQIYENIGDNYSQGRNLVLFIGPTQLQLGQTEAAIESFQIAAEIGQTINFEPLTEYAQQQIADIQTSSH